MWQKTIDSAELTSTFRKQLQLCKLKSGETLVLLTDTGSDRRCVDAAFAVATEMGAIVYEIHVRKGTDDRSLQSDPFTAPGLAEALSKADLILTFFLAYFSKWEKAATDAGARILQVLDDGWQLSRMQSTPALKAAVIATAKRLERTSTVQVLSDAGTDFSWEIDKELPIPALYGAADEPGIIGLWGQGMVACFPIEGSARGRVVVQPGDVWALPYARMVQTPIHLEVRDGFVRSVEGGVDAFAFKRILDNAKISAADMDPYAISHLGWGLNPLASWDDIMLYENNASFLMTSMRSYPGHFLFSTGPSPRRKTRGHIDMPMNGCTILLDNEVVVDHGRVVAPEMIVDPNRTTH